MPSIQDTIIKAIQIKGGEILKDRRLLINVIEDLSPDLYSTIVFINKIYIDSVGELLYRALSTKASQKKELIKDIDRILKEEEDRGLKSRKAFLSCFVPAIQGELGNLESKNSADQLIENTFEKNEGLARQEDAKAQFTLAQNYYYGNGVTQNYKKAFEWYQKAANQGNEDAQYNLGVCYENGRGVSKDYRKAFEWYQKAANQGHADAQNRMGYFYENAYGVSKVYEKAFEWYQKAAEQGIVNAKERVDYYRSRKMI